MKVKKMGITEILRRIWLFSANKIKSSESGSKQPTQLIVKLNSSLKQTSNQPKMCNTLTQEASGGPYLDPNKKVGKL